MSAADHLTDERNALAAFLRKEVGWPNRQSTALADGVLALLAARGVRAPGDTTADRDALARVRAYLSALDAHYGDELNADVLDSADGGPTSPLLLLSDVRVLAARPAPDTLAAHVQALLDEHARSVSPAPYTSERALVERLEALLAGRPDASPEGGEQRG